MPSYTRPRISSAWTFVLTIVLALAALYLASLYNYLLFHTVVEGFTIVIGCGVFMVAWNSRGLLTNDYLLFLGIAYLFVAIIDLAHTMGYPGMGVFPGYDANLATQFWIGARYLESISLLAAPLFLRRRVPLKTVASVYGIASLAILIIVFGGWFPDCFVEGHGLTSFKIGSEYVISLILIAAAFMLYRYRNNLDNKVFWLISASIIVTVISEMAFTLYVDVYGLQNLVGHFLRLVSYYLVYKAIIEIGLSKPYDLLFRDLKRTQEALSLARDSLEERITHRTRDLVSLNEKLTGEVEARRQSEWALRERVKELRTLYELGRVVEDQMKPVDEALAEATRVLPGGWQYPDSAVSAIEWEDQVYGAESLGDCRSTISAPLVVEGEPVGTVTVGYLDRFPAAFEGPFLKEERELINMVADRLANMIERQQAEAQRVALEQQLRQSQKMESVGRLAGGVAHDFNNMLGVILGNVEILLEEVDSSDPHYGDLMDIQMAAHRATDLTRQLLAFARKQTIDPRVLDLNTTIEGMTGMLERLIGENIDLQWKPANMRLLVQMDPGQIEQVLVNLVINARDAIQSTGQLMIESSLVSVEDTWHYADVTSGEYVMLAVSDDGVGMDAETRAAIFEPFFTTKPQGSGTGLGLATVYGIVRQNGGFINVYSEPGQGATFRVYFPHCRESTVTDPEPPDTTIATGGNKMILVVEDELSLLTLTTRQLERLGYTVLAANTPERALELVLEEEVEIDLLLTDIVMPGMNGNDLFAELTRLRPGLKCVFMSGYTANVIAHSGILENNVHFLQKPFSQGDLTAKLHELLNG